MCQVTDGKLHHILKPRLAYKVVTVCGCGPFYDPDNVKVNWHYMYGPSISWFSGRVFSSIPKVWTHRVLTNSDRSIGESIQSTNCGFHVFSTLKEARKYKNIIHGLRRKLTIMRVLVWGNYFKYGRSGMAIEFATMFSRKVIEDAKG